MRKNPKHIGLVVILAALAISFLGVGAPIDGKDEETITGLVTTADWDDEDNLIAVAISVATVIENQDEEEETVIENYLLADNDKGRELLKLVGEEVEATGKVTTDDAGNKTIHVTAYRVIEEDPNN